MKAKKHWNRRVLSFLLALAMVVTQLGVWNVGKESVQAAEDSVIYSDDMENDADEIDSLATFKTSKRCFAVL